MLKKFRLSLYTFGAVFLAVFIVGVLIVPTALNLAQRIYFTLQTDVNLRQTHAMRQFVLNRLQSGVSSEDVIREFQAAIEGTQTDRGYLCLIDQGDIRYLSHPDTAVLGMQVKPNAHFDPNFSGQNESQWQEFIEQGESAGGLLDIGPDMSPEIVYFTTVPGTKWTVSSHENTVRIKAEIRKLRKMLGLGAALLGFLIAIPASFAARSVSSRYERQVEQENELKRRLLEAENARKTEELEKARQLQLSMLPTEVPKHPFVDLAVYMQTATEVGGDYYDFDLDPDGTLTVVIGDATGHGLQAGTMVTATKSLFTQWAREQDMLNVLKQLTRTLKRMDLPNLYMALALAKLRNHTLELVGAGMPPGLVYRAATGQIEQVSLKGMPLGSVMDFPYQKATIKLAPGDVVILMSDGFPELFNKAGEMLDYERAVAVFAEVVSQTPKEIIEHFVEKAATWLNGQPQNDDMTFVVMKVKDTVTEA